MTNARTSSLCLSLLALLVACSEPVSSSSELDPAGIDLGTPGGAGGSSGSAGSAGTSGGKSGSGGSAGDGGSGGESGEAGSAGDAGAGGEAGASGSAGDGGSAGESGEAGSAGESGSGGSDAGSAGSGGSTPPCEATPLINELLTHRTTDSGVDEAYEFLELLNPASSTCAISLGEYALYKDGASIWQGMGSTTLKKGGRYVIAGKSFAQENGAIITVAFSSAAALPKDGACIELRRGDSTVDAVCYGSAADRAPAPGPLQSIARIPDGHDTDDDAADFALRTPTPNKSND